MVILPICFGKLRILSTTQNKEDGSVRWCRPFTVPYFLRKTVEIEEFALRAAILNECQIHLGGGGRFPKPAPSVAFENQDDWH